jgi:hypothetical protein
VSVLKRIVYASPEAISDVAEGAFHRADGLSMDEIAEYLGKSARYAADVAAAAVSLGILALKDGRYKTSQEASDLAKASFDQRPLVFRKFLIRYDPFVIFATLIVKGYKVDDSARRVKVIFSVTEPLSMVINALRSWGRYAGIIEHSQQGERIVGVTEEKLTEQYLEDFIRALQDEFHAKLFIASKIGDAAFAFLKETEKTYLINSLQKYRDHPDDSMKDVGNTLENFLRNVATERTLPTTQAQKGIGQLANILRANRVILEEHKKMCDYVNIFRIAADHGNHPETLQPWKIESDSALEAFLSNLTTIRSIYSFVSSSGQIL